MIDGPKLRQRGRRLVPGRPGRRHPRLRRSARSSRSVAVEDIPAAVDPEPVTRSRPAPITTRWPSTASRRLTAARSTSSSRTTPTSAARTTTGSIWRRHLGTPMLASDGGTVKYAGWCDCGLGLFIEIDHENGTSTVYGHMNAVYVETGQDVNQGDDDRRDRQHRHLDRPARALHAQDRRQHGRSAGVFVRVANRF